MGKLSQSNLDFSGSITIYKLKNNCRGRRIYLSSSFFNNEVFVKVDDRKIVFKIATITYEGKRLKPTKDKYSNFHISLTCEFELTLGKFEFDIEESDEDCRVVYYK